ncbi:MAG: hypothetical protein AAFP93_02515 [Bacteroidota bacterium]
MNILHSNYSSSNTFLLFFISCWLSYDRAALANQRQNSSKLPVEKKFDTVRKYDSYDPATSKWSSIEDFRDVKILEDHSQKHEERYLYHNFWAYDRQKEEWCKVDIRDHGYKLGDTAKKEYAPKDEEELEKDKLQDSVWKNLMLSIGVGAGPTMYVNQLHKSKDANLALKKRDSYLYLQNGAKWYRLYWLARRPVFKPKFGTQPAIANTLDVSNAHGVKFIDAGGNLPITLAAHYTFARRLRIGGGGNLIISYLPRLTPQGHARILGDFILNNKMNYHVGWFGLVGFKVLHATPHDIIIDIRVGQAFDFGGNLVGERVYSGWNYNGGLGYERKLNGYFKLMTRLAFDWQSFTEKLGTKKTIISMQQPAIHFQIGINLNFGRDAEGDNLSVEAAENTEKGSRKAERAGEKIMKGASRAKGERDRLKRPIKSGIFRKPLTQQ